jgi:dTDP-4-amino-4,6-dideoxygalactose transaminase
LVIFSFHPVKHIAAGEGGMITTNNKSLYDKLLRLRTHGITKDPSLLKENHGGWYYEMLDLGYNYRLSDINAALALSQIEYADKRLKQRRKIAKKYDEAFLGSKIQPLKTHHGKGHAYHLYVILADRRKDLYEFLRAKNIFTQVHYIPVHSMPYYRNLGWRNGDFPAAESYYKKCLSLPMYPTLKLEEQQYVIDNILSFINE